MSLSDLSPGEKAYMESGGQDTTALLAENPGSGGSTPPEPAAPTPEALAPAEPAVSATAPAAPAADPLEPGEEEIATGEGKPKRRVVDSRALKEARQRAKDAEAELQKYRENYTRVDERLKMLSEAVSQPEPSPAATPEEPETPIDPEQDIFGAYKQQQKQLAKLNETIEALRTGQTEMREQTETERQTAALVSTYKQDAAAFTQKTPDFNEAYNFLLAKRGQQLAGLGYGEAEVATMLYNEEMSLASRALGMRKSPAEFIYNLASSMGYSKAAPAAPAAAPVPSATAPAAAAAPASVTAEIDRIKKGQESSRSLSTGGGAAGEEVSLELLANMPQKEFEAFMNKPGNRERVEAAMGRRAA